MYYVVQHYFSVQKLSFGNWKKILGVVINFQNFRTCKWLFGNFNNECQYRNSKLLFLFFISYTLLFFPNFFVDHKPWNWEDCDISDVAAFVIKWWFVLWRIIKNLKSLDGSRRILLVFTLSKPITKPQRAETHGEK